MSLNDSGFNKPGFNKPGFNKPGFNQGDSGPIVKTFLQQLQSFSGLTFYKNFATSQAAAGADYSVGSPTATVVAARSAGSPATYFDAAGLIHTLTTANTPRWTQGYYDATGFHLLSGLWIETGGSATTGKNTLLQSTAFTNVAWIQTTMTAADSVTDGVLSATVSTLTSTLANGSCVQAVVDAVAGLYTASIFIKRKTGTGTVNLRANILDSYTDITASVGTGWTRVQVTSSSKTNPAFDISLGTSGDAIYIYGAQLEKFPYMTSYIPTTTAGVARAGEQLSYVNLGNRTAAQESIFVKFVPLGGSFANDGLQRTFLDSDTKNRQMFKQSSSTQIRVLPNAVDTASVLAGGTTTALVGQSYIVAGTMQPNAPANYVTEYGNGVSEGGYTAGVYTANAWGTNFYVGSRGLTTSGQLNGILQSIAFYSTWFQDPDVNSVSFLLSPDTVTKHTYTFTPSTPSASNLVSGAAGNGNVLANSNYNWHDHYTCADTGWTLNGQTGETILLFQTIGADDQITPGPATQPIGDIIFRTYTKSTNTMGDPPTTVWTDPTYMAINDIYVQRNANESFFRVYFNRALRSSPTTIQICMIKSTDLTATSWSTPVVIMNNAANFGGFLNGPVAGQQLMVFLGNVVGGGPAVFSTTNGGDTFTFYSVMNGITNYSEGEFINAPDGSGRILGVTRDNAGNFLLQVTSSDWGLTWSGWFSTGLGQSTGAKVTPKLKRAAGDPTRVMVYFYDRGDSRLKVGTPTKFDNAFAGTWLGTYLIGTYSQGNGGFLPIDYNLRRYIVSTNTGIEPTNALNWWIYKDIYTWVQTS